MRTLTLQERLALEALAAHREQHARIVQKRLNRLLAELRAQMGGAPDLQTLYKIEYDVAMISACVETLLDNERHDTAALARLFE